MAKKNMNSRTSNKKSKKEYTVVMYIFFFMFLALMGYFMYFQLVLSKTYVNSPYNSLQNIAAERVRRGDIKSSDGKVLATTKTKSNGDETREYPYGNLFAHVVGFSSHGKSGLENRTNFELLSSHDFILNQVFNDFTERKNDGDNVITTLDYNVQKSAYDALGQYDGAVIVMQPKTGKVLAMVSKPDFDPNKLSEQWDNLNRQGSTALYNRATQGKYAPGSVFKILTTLEFINENKATYETFSYRCTGGVTANGHTLHDAGGEKHGDVNLRSAFAESCNSAYGTIAKDLNVKKFNDFCDSMLFNKNLPIDFESSQSKFKLNNTDNDYLKMATGIGQGNTLVSPLHMLLITSSIDNDGVLMKPYLVDKIENAQGTEISSNSPKKQATLLTKEQANIMQDYMSSVVQEGTASRLKGQSYQVFGKTGTAQVSDSTDKTNAWFVGYAKKDGYDDIAIAVVVEDSGYGSKYAVPAAKKVFDTYFN
ncbi:peptidoglycan glycosyltransferase [Lachnospiraceae bacterium C7]|nr:peptidoglycan glycosyltransferase [Lachnospiraceae bacterium C7]